MANETVAIGWLLAHSQEFQLQVETLPWINRAFPGWSDVHCQVVIKGNELTSWGAASTPDISLLKAFAEATERAVLYEVGSATSNGFAAHLSQAKARQNAMCELIERDLFFCHFLTCTKFIPFPQSKTKNWTWISQIYKLAKDLDLRLRYYMLGNSGVMCAIDGLESRNKIGFIVGTSYKETVEEAAISATIESFRQAYFIRTSSYSSNLSLDSFLRMDKPDFKDHGSLAINIDYARQIESLFSFEETPSCTYPFKELSIEDLVVTDLSWITNDCPFFFAKAESPNAQTLFLGAPQGKDINLKRLQDFTNNQITLPNINILPHPFN